MSKQNLLFQPTNKPRDLNLKFLEIGQAIV